MDKPGITIIGMGQVGTALLRALKAKGYTITSVFNRSEVRNSLRGEMESIRFRTGLPELPEDLGDITFITVSDDVIGDLAQDLASRFSTFDGKAVVHCSGTCSSKSLLSLKNKGAGIASFHPMKAITINTHSFEGTWFDFEGDDLVLDKLERIAIDLDANTFRVSAESKPLLHASAVVASNYLVVLADLVKRIAELAGVDKDIALKAITPLMQNTLINIREMGVTEALTGPIARGDTDTIAEHIQRLKKDKAILSLYKVLGREAISIAEKKNEAREDALGIIRELLK